MHVAYLVNQYPKVSHTFIRRELLALERRGISVTRFAIRGFADQVVDPEDLRERDRTRYVLHRGVPGLFAAAAKAMATSPWRFFSALRLAVSMGLRSDRSLPYHFAYLAEACQLASWCRDSGVEHLHAHFGTNPAEVAMLAHVLGGPPYSFTVHGPEEFDRPAFIGISEKIRRAAFVVAISSFGRSQLLRWCDYRHWPKVKVVHCGLETAFHDVPPVPPPVFPRFVCVGRLCEQKGQLLLVDAARRLREKGLDFQIVLAGDGEMRGEIERLVDAYGLQGRIVITGWISSDEVRKEILASRALILPSFAEGLPVVIMEAMALRRPVLTTYVAGIPELVVSGESGWLFPAGSVEALVAAVEDSLGRSKEDLTRMGQAAFERVLARHNIDTEAARLARLFEDSASIRTGAPA